LMMNPVPWLQMTNMISYQGLVRTFPYACWSLTAGANPAFIANQMGHADAQMVFQVYGKWMSENNNAQVALLNTQLSEFAPTMPHNEAMKN
ncbi:hypothetical protein OFD51_15985, partial [Escherichia coli]|nr:hypothetical protein [Escherichia coli]